MLDFLEMGKAIYVLFAVCFIGIVSKLASGRFYKRLIRESANLTLTKEKSLRNLKQQAENTYRINQGINNARTYLEKQLYGFRMGRFSLMSWDNLAVVMALGSFFLGGVGAFLAYWYRLDSYYIVLYGSMGILGSILIFMVDQAVGTEDKRQQLLCSLQDYLENTLSSKLEREKKPSVESFQTEPFATETFAEEPRKEDGKPERDTDYLKRSLTEIAASREKTKSDENWMKKLKPEEVKLVGEILREYLS